MAESSKSAKKPGSLVCNNQILSCGLVLYFKIPLFTSEQHENHTSAEAVKINKSETNEKGKTKKKKARTTFSGSQLYYLEEIFSYTKYLSRIERQKIAIKLRVTPTVIKTWYQNRRTRWKKENPKTF